MTDNIHSGFEKWKAPSQKNAYNLAEAYKKSIEEWRVQQAKDFRKAAHNHQMNLYLEQHPHVQHHVDDEGLMQLDHDGDRVHFKLSMVGRK